MIEIVYYSEEVDNWDGVEISKDPKEISKILQTPDEFTDDMKFKDSYGKMYFIDDLIGQEVKVGEEVFVVPSD